MIRIAGADDQGLPAGGHLGETDHAQLYLLLGFSPALFLLSLFFFLRQNSHNKLAVLM